MSMTIGKQRPDEDLEHETLYWRSPRTIAAAVVLACAAAGVAWAVTGDGDAKKATAPAAYDSACGLTGGTTAEPTEAPLVQWQNLDGNWQPVSTTQGPGRRSATGPWTCYAHTPTGALIAAWGIPARIGAAPDFATAVKQQTVPGPGQAALLKAGPGDTPVSERPVPIGYQVNAYDGDAATITLYLSQRGASIACATGMQWNAEKRDWLLRVGTDGSVWLGCQQVPNNLGGIDLVRWGPHS
jgi:hypothetical protein